MDQWLGGRDSELTCVCSRTGVSNGPGDSYPAAGRLANVSVRRPLLVKHSSKREAAANDIFDLCRWESLFKIWTRALLVSPIQPTSVSAYHTVHTSCDSRTAWCSSVKAPRGSQDYNAQLQAQSSGACVTRTFQSRVSSDPVPAEQARSESQSSQHIVSGVDPDAVVTALFAAAAALDARRR